MVWQKEGFLWILKGLFILCQTKEKKVIDTLRIGGRSEKTISNYVHAIYRFLEYFQDKDISTLDEDDIVILNINI